MTYQDQREILQWAEATFGPIALDPQERALRFVEEAIEAAHAAGAHGVQIIALVTRVYNRPPGPLPVELAQAGLTLAAFAANACVDIDKATREEFARVLERSPLELRQRQEAKTAAGLTAAALPPGAMSHMSGPGIDRCALEFESPTFADPPADDAPPELAKFADWNHVRKADVTVWQEIGRGWIYGEYPDWRYSGHYGDSRTAVMMAERRGFKVTAVEQPAEPEAKA